jgi:hypothetical protein
MDPFEHSLRNAQCDVPSLVARTPFSDHKHARLVLEKFANFVRTQVPHFGDFRNGIMPLDVHRGLDLGWYGHCVAATPPGFAKIDEYLVDWLSGFRKH